MDKHLVPQPPPPPPPSTVKRMRQRGREVSSRYMMTPSPISAPSSPIHSSSTSSLAFSPKLPTHPHSLPSSSRNTLLHHRKLRRIPSVPSSPDNTDSETESEPSSRYADENNRNLVTPHLPAVQAKAPSTLRKRAVRLFSDNTVHTTQPQIVEQFKGIMEPRAALGPRRPGTPTLPNPIRTAASNLIQLGAAKKTSTHECQRENFTSSFSDNLSSCDDPVTGKSRINTLGGLCHSPPIRSHGNGRARQASDLRSSMPEADLLATTSARRPAELEDSACRRSLNSVFSGLNTPSLLKSCHSMTDVRQRFNFVRTCLPPQAPTSRLGLELKKGRKGLSRQEDVHTLCLLHNQFLQWRFVNSKAKVAMRARTITAERSLAQASDVLEELRDSVNKKRVKLENLRRMRTLSNILDVEMPFLEQWPLVDGEYTASLSGAIKSLQDASIRLPIGGDLEVDFRELKDAINSASCLFESLSSIESFLPTADVVDKVSNNLASLASKEKALLEECGDLLSEAQMLQVKECSLRSMLLQAK